MSFYENYLRMCAEHGETPSGAAAAIGLSNAAASGWKNGKKPSDVTLTKLAKHFQCRKNDLLWEGRIATPGCGLVRNDREEKEMVNRNYLPKDKRLLPSEGEEQARLFSWCRMQSGMHPELGLLFHIPNGGSRNKAEAGRFKAEGVKAGVPDLLLPVARGEYHGLFIELKRLDGGRVRPEQKAWMDKLKEQGYQAVVCRGWEGASEALLRYLALGEESGPSRDDCTYPPAPAGQPPLGKGARTVRGEGYGCGEGKRAAEGIATREERATNKALLGPYKSREVLA